MNNKILRIFVISGIITLLIACNSNNKNTENINEVKHDNVITTKIMYDVPIVNEIIGDRSKDNIDSWYWENLPTPDGENFVKKLLNDAEKGKIKVYEYDLFSNYDTFPEIPQSEIKAFLKKGLEYLRVTLDTTVNPAKIVEQKIPLDYKNVKKLRFLEEWYIEDQKLCKQVIAIAPLFYVEEMENPFAVFWIKEIK